eukprot:9253475-Pyramimonas_sp.AAC.1
MGPLRGSARRSYADDLTKKLIGGRRTSAASLAIASSYSNQDLDACLGPAGYKQNLTKQDTLLSLFGRGVGSAYQVIRSGDVRFPGKPSQLVKSLGVMMGTSSLYFGQELKARLAAVRAGWHSLGSFWHLAGVPHRFR